MLSRYGNDHFSLRKQSRSPAAIENDENIAESGRIFFHSVRLTFFLFTDVSAFFD